MDDLPAHSARVGKLICPYLVSVPCPWVISVGQTRLFPELVALLPDIQTQQNMYLAAHEYSKRKKQAYGDAGFDRLSVCPLSGQILLAQDVAAHMAELETMQVCTASPNLPFQCPDTRGDNRLATS